MLDIAFLREKRMCVLPWVVHVTTQGIFLVDAAAGLVARIGSASFRGYLGHECKDKLHVLKLKQ
jgi:hypothetical protein